MAPTNCHKWDISEENICFVPATLIIRERAQFESFCDLIFDWWLS